MPISILYLSHPNRQYALDLIGAYSDGFARRILRGFATIEPEATAAAEALFNERMNRVCGPDGPDEDAGSVADDAREHGFSVYSDLEFVRRLVTGLAIAGLYHLWERLLKEFLVREFGQFRPAIVPRDKVPAAADDLSAGTPCHAKRVMAQPVSNGTLITGSDRLWRNIQAPSTRAQVS